jgi:SprT-like protein
LGAIKLELQNLVEQVSIEDFGLPFEHQAVWNNRLRTTGGLFYPKDCHLAFNPLMYQKLTSIQFRQIIRHELCHYHLFRQKKGFHHRDKDFKKLLAEVDGLRYSPRVIQKKYRVYQCQKCGHEFVRVRQIDVNRFRCGNCSGKLIYQMDRYL